MAEGLEGARGLSRRLSAIGGPTANRRTLTTLQAAAIRESKILAPRKTSNLSRSIHPGMVTDDYAEIRVSAAYAAAQEFGAKPHDIKPKRQGGVLAFAWVRKGGQVRLTGSPTTSNQQMSFFRGVHHPGNPAHPFMAPGMRRAVENAGLSKAIIQEWNNAD